MLDLVGHARCRAVAAEGVSCCDQDALHLSWPGQRGVKFLMHAKSVVDSAHDLAASHCFSWSQNILSLHDREKPLEVAEHTISHVSRSTSAFKAADILHLKCSVSCVSRLS